MSAGLYIHIPFCASKCVYCDFVSAKSADDTKRAYVDALIGELKYVGSRFDDIVDTVYIGGGTPSCLPRGELKRIADAVFSNFDCRVAEFSAEANPESFDEAKAAEYKACGITRVSLGVQSTDDDILRFLGRAHDFATAKRAAELAARSFDLSLDLMLGLPGQSKKSVDDFAAFADGAGAVHISAYMLKVERGTPLAKRVQGGLVLPDDDACADLYDAFVQAAADRGYKRYETSNFARDGKRCLHNLKYWQGDDYLGVGVSAHGKTGFVRYFVPSDTAAYISRAQRGEFVYENEEELTPQTAADEYVMTALRLDEGVDKELFESRYGFSFDERYGAKVAAAADFLDVGERYVAIKPRYTLLANAVISKIIL